MGQKKSFAKQAYNHFQKQKDLRGFEAMKEGVDYYTDIIQDAIKSYPNEDAGLIAFAMETIATAIRKGIPAADETAKIAAAAISAIIIAAPSGLSANDEREDEEI